MAMSPDELRSTIEAILFVSGEPVSLDRLTEALPGEGREAIAAELDRIRAHFDEHVGGFGLEEAGGGFRFASRPAHDSIIRKFFAKQGEGRLSLAALETLAIIAYRQPMTAPEISDIRGVNSSGVLRTLLDRRMIRIAGRKAVVGSPFLYRTTREFLMHFGLNTVQDLPRLEEFADLLGENVGEEFLTEAVQESENTGVSDREDLNAASEAAANSREEQGGEISQGSASEQRDIDAEDEDAADTADEESREDENHVSAEDDAEGADDTDVVTRDDDESELVASHETADESNGTSHVEDDASKESEEE